MLKLDFVPGEIFRGTTVYHQRDGLAYAYTTTHAAVDADGAPNAYHPDDVGKKCGKEPHVGLECPAHAGYPNTTWWNKVLVPDPHTPTKAYVQKGGQYDGFFVCMTSLRQSGGDKYSPATYVDAREIPYVVIPTGFDDLPFCAKQGDVGFACHKENGKSTAFIVADYGGGKDAKLGEASIALFEALGGKDVNPQNGAGVAKGTYQYVIFRNSSPEPSHRWPRTNRSIEDQVRNLISQTPGVDFPT